MTIQRIELNGPGWTGATFAEALGLEEVLVDAANMTSLNVGEASSLLELELRDCTSLTTVVLPSAETLTDLVLTDCSALNDVQNSTSLTSLTTLNLDGANLLAAAMTPLFAGIFSVAGSIAPGLVLGFSEAGGNPAYAEAPPLEFFQVLKTFDASATTPFVRVNMTIGQANANVRWNHDNTAGEQAVEVTALIFDDSTGVVTSGTGTATQNNSHTYPTAGPNDIVIYRSEALGANVNRTKPGRVANFRDLRSYSRVQSLSSPEAFSVYNRLQLQNHEMSVIDLTDHDLLARVYINNSNAPAVTLIGFDSLNANRGFTVTRQLYAQNGNLSGALDLSGSRPGRIDIRGCDAITSIDFTGCEFRGNELLYMDGNDALTTLDFSGVAAGSTWNCPESLMQIQNCPNLTSIITVDGNGVLDTERPWFTNCPAMTSVITVGGNCTSVAMTGVGLQGVVVTDGARLTSLTGGSNPGLATSGATGLGLCLDIESITTFNDSGLSQAQVDSILSQVAGSIGSYTFANPLLSVGGSNAAPSAAGLADVAALTAAGWTVGHS